MGNIEYLNICANAVSEASTALAAWGVSTREVKLSNVNRMLAHVMSASSHQEVCKDQDVINVVNQFFQRDRRIQSISAVADELKLDRQYVRRARCTATAAAVSFDRLGRHALEERVVATDGVERLLYIDYSRHDATTLSLRMRESLASLQEEDGAIGEDRGEMILGTAEGQRADDVVPAKILQVEGKFAMLVRINGNLVHFRGTKLQELVCL